MLGLRRYKSAQIDVWQGDITTFAVDAIINAANETLSGGLGVDGAIHSVGGPTILEECKQLSGCPTGSSVVTRAGLLPATWVIHAVGPIWSGGNSSEPDLLRQCYLSIFQTAEQLTARHISIPAISTGAYGFPKKQAAFFAFETVKKFLDLNSHKSLRRVSFVAFDEAMYDVLQESLFARFPDELDQEGY